MHARPSSLWSVSPTNVALCEYEYDLIYVSGLVVVDYNLYVENDDLCFENDYDLLSLIHFISYSISFSIRFCFHICSLGF